MKTGAAITALIIAIVAGVNLFDLARRMPLPARGPVAQNGDVAMRHERRLAGVRKALRSHAAHGLIGYVTDLPPAELPNNDAAMQEYFLSQFALVPWVLEADFTQSAWAVTNLRTKSRADGLPAGFRVVKDFGGGVLLLRKTEP